ncbi:MAG TPA: hypothetical protein VGQ95_12610 [Chthoniobacterales bacterium]|jgi:hypothetical protein|nr:hypothetical protein [Chthoniobacterales bacterium]HXM74809.1 hypothetical protein [Chthoniobacterales bacterium]
MRRTLIAFLSCTVLLLISSGTAQTPDSKDEQELLALVKEVQGQQAQLLGNQAKIETKLTEIAETIRVARIFSGRSE